MHLDLSGLFEKANLIGHMVDLDKAAFNQYSGSLRYDVHTMAAQYVSWLQSPRRVRQAILPVTLITIVTLLIVRTKNIPRSNVIVNVETSLQLDLNQVLSQELLLLLKQDVPPVEDVGESIMDDWFKKEEEFCDSIKSNESSPFLDTYVVQHAITVEVC
ncbi:hypothetical protein AHF37_09539 [Paragonimus kellicotti]|nr:hypothetical protein AHF37_09539 [Paragonimus kellicotti]